jgi:hypothetical protein
VRWIVGNTVVAEDRMLEVEELVANHLNYLIEFIEEESQRISSNTLVELIGMLILIGFDLR